MWDFSDPEYDFVDKFGIGHFCWGMSLLLLFEGDLWNATLWHVNWELFEVIIGNFSVSNTVGDVLTGFLGSCLALNMVKRN